MSLPSRFRPLGWTPGRLARATARGLPNVPGKVLRTRYPFRLLRYWFMHELLLDAARASPFPLSIAEVGVDQGQQLAFARNAFEPAEGAPFWYRWDAYDCQPSAAALSACGYTDVVAVDVDSPRASQRLRPGCYDVVIACHVLEHLFDPEAAVERLSTMLRPGGVLIGGGPVTPHVALGWRERLLRRRARPFGHVSVLSTSRLDAMARRACLETQWQGGAFLMRKRGFALENHVWWLRLNLAFGALFPGWPGEVYFAWRRQQGGTAPAPTRLTAAPSSDRLLPQHFAPAQRTREDRQNL